MAPIRSCPGEDWFRPVFSNSSVRPVRTRALFRASPLRLATTFPPASTSESSECRIVVTTCGASGLVLSLS